MAMLERPAPSTGCWRSSWPRRRASGSRLDRLSARLGRAAQRTVTAPSEALRDQRRVLAPARPCGRDWRAPRRPRRGAAISSSSSATSMRRLSTSKVIVSPSRTAAIGPPRAASGATWPAMKPWVAPEKRPSVSSATLLAEPLAHDRGGDRQHLAHARPAGRALVADDDDVAGLDAAVRHGRHRRLLALEHARRAAVVAPLVAGELDDAARRARGCRAGWPGRRWRLIGSSSGRTTRWPCGLLGRARHARRSSGRSR